MRTEKEMYELIEGYALKDKRVRIVAMNGSRVNDNVPKDRWQDYDIAYVVDDIDSMIKDRSWIEVFGKRLIMQIPSEGVLIPMKKKPWYSMLMQFEDGNRIDLTLVPLESLEDYLKNDRLVKILLDKDSLITGTLPATDKDRWIKKPTEALYRECINEFLWLSFYVVKGLKRSEVIYAMEYVHQMRLMLLKMMEWRVGYKTDFKISIGKKWKHLNYFFSDELWSMLMSTYELGSAEQCWDALETMISLFEIVADRVGDQEKFVYNRVEYHNVRLYVYNNRHNKLSENVE